MIDLLIDPAIRVWVFLPIVLITLLVGILHHYFTILATPQKDVTLAQIEHSHAWIRSRLLRENGKYLTEQGFLMRKNFFNHPQHGYFKKQHGSPVAQYSTSSLIEVSKGNLVNVLPMVVIGGWINWIFSGFVTTKVPFPLTLRFKPMLQRGIELKSLDPSWVSSASWYFLNYVGLRSFYALLFGEDNSEQGQHSDDSNVYAAIPNISQNLKAIFKAEWESLELLEYKSELANVEKELFEKALQSEETKLTKPKSKK